MLAKKTLKNLPFHEFYQTGNIDPLKPYSSWLLPQAMAFLAEVPVPTLGFGKYSPSGFLANLKDTHTDPDWVLGLLKYLTTPKRGDIVEAQNKNTRYAANVPLILSAFKQNRGISYNSWDWSDPKIYSWILDPQLAEYIQLLKEGMGSPDSSSAGVSNSVIAPTVDDSVIAPTVIAPTVDDSVIVPTVIAPTVDDSVIAPTVDDSVIAPTVDDSVIAPTVIAPTHASGVQLRDLGSVWSAEEIIEFRRIATEIQSGSRAGLHRNILATTSALRTPDPTFNSLPKLAKLALIQAWIFHPSIRSDYGVCSTTSNLEEQPSPLIDSEIFNTTSSTPALVKKSIPKKGELPW